MAPRSGAVAPPSARVAQPLPKTLLSPPKWVACQPRQAPHILPLLLAVEGGVAGGCRGAQTSRPL